MMTSKFLLYAILYSGLYLLAISVSLHLVEKWLRLRQAVRTELLEPVTLGWVLTNFIAESVFYVLIPTLAYAFFYFVLPFSGMRAGISASLFAFTLGAVPLLMSLSLRVKLPMPYLLFILFAHLLKLSGCLIIIGLLYTI